MNIGTIWKLNSIRCRKALRTRGQGVLVVLIALGLLALSLPLQAGPKYDANVFGAPVSAADGTTIAMIGQIQFELAPGKSASGGGTFDIGGGAITGNWHATQLEGFHVKGRCGDYPDCLAAGVPPDFTAGKGSFKISLEGIGTARFIMWCRLPGIPLPKFSAFPESYRVDIGSLHFDSQDLAGNFFELKP